MKITESLSGYILANQEKIIERWMEKSLGRAPLTIVRSLSRDDFRDGIPAVLERFAATLGEEPIEEENVSSCESTRLHGHDRWKQGFDLTALLHDWGTLHETVTEVLGEFFERQTQPLGVKRWTEVQRKTCAFFTEATSSSVDCYDQIRRAEAASVGADLERAKAHFDKLHANRTTLIREISHDMRGELTTIKGASSILQVTQDGGNDDPCNIGSIIDESVSSVTEILDLLLDLSRLEAGAETLDVEMVNVGELLRNVTASLSKTAADKGLRLEAEGPEALEVHADYHKIRRIVQNLVINALKYTDEGRVSVQWALHKKNWELRIADTGPGLRGQQGTPLVRELNDPTEIVADGRSPAERRGAMDYEGEGIGLTIVKRLCTLLDATIDVQSVTGEGTTFTLTFPITYSKSGVNPGKHEAF